MPQRILQTVKKTRYQTGLWLLLLASPAPAGDILLQIDGRQGDAPLFLALVAGELDAWPAAPLLQQHSSDGLAQFTNLAPGRYAIQVFQDLNGNGRLDQGRRGIPLEPVGFSGNPALVNGKPTPAQASFEHGEDHSQLLIHLQSPKARR